MISKDKQERSNGERVKRNTEILRLAIIAELEAINLYEQPASTTDNENVKKILLDVAHEEKVHVGEFLTMLLKFDKEQVGDLEAGRKEVEELLGEL